MTIKEPQIGQLHQMLDRPTAPAAKPVYIKDNHVEYDLIAQDGVCIGRNCLHIQDFWLKFGPLNG